MVEASTRGRWTVANGALAAAASAALVATAFAVSRSEADETSVDPHAGIAIDAPLGDVDTMIARLELRLKGDPADVAGWRMLGWSRLQTGRAADAVVAYERAVALAPDDAATWSSLGEAISPTQILQRRAMPFARAGARSQGFVGALHPSVDQGAVGRTGRARSRTGLPCSTTPRPMPTGSASARQGVERGQGNRNGYQRAPAQGSARRLPRFRDRPAQQMAAASALPAGEQQAMIDGMVARLDARLAANPRDVEGWSRLMRARMVLGQATPPQRRSGPGCRPSPTTRRRRRGCGRRRRRSTFRARTTADSRG
jgi:cytochrome c-type biogenesis protein CcmH